MRNDDPSETVNPTIGCGETSSQKNPRASTADGTEATTAFLLRILTEEIAKDGGACLVTTLKEYVIADYGPNELREPLQANANTNAHGNAPKKGCHKSSKKRNHQLNSLLSRSNIGKPKLLAFLESHMDVFAVDRTVIPHWVKLVAPARTTSSCSIRDDEQLQTELAARVLEKASYVLRRRQARLERRQNRSFSMEDDCGVNCHWLLRQCAWEFHFFLRHSGFYANPSLCGYRGPGDVKQVGSKEWEDVVLAHFESLLGSDVAIDDSKECPQQPSFTRWIHVENGKAYFRESASPEERGRLQQSDNHNDERVPNSNTSSTSSVDDGSSSSSEERHREHDRKPLDANETTLALVRIIDQTLTEIVCEKDGGHQIALRLILHRYPRVKELLGGRDLWRLYRDYSNVQDPLKNAPNTAASDATANENGGVTNENDGPQYYLFFQSITMFYTGQHLVLRSKRPKTITNNADNASNDSCEEKRMKVDEEGLYSVTNNKWGRAMSTLVIQACRRTNLFGDAGTCERDETAHNKNVSSEKSTSADKILVDLTASVGGMTLALARSNYFDRVIALEIDKVRAGLCRENLNRYGYYDEDINNDSSTSSKNSDKTIVQVRHDDSVQQIPFLPKRACFVVDPPWGGYDYKEKVRREQVLRLGDTSLEDVLARIAHHNAPCVVGLRLPINFVVQDFLNALERKEVTFECMTRRKISVQLFVVLYFPPKKRLPESLS